MGYDRAELTFSSQLRCRRPGPWPHLKQSLATAVCGRLQEEWRQIQARALKGQFVCAFIHKRSF